MNIIDTPTRRILQGRGSTPIAVVLHGTGETDLDKILDFYTSPAGLQPHYFVETLGTIRRIVAEDHVAYHAKIDAAEARLYQQGYRAWCEWTWKDERPVHQGEEFTGYRSWRETWRDRGFQSPLELITGARPNFRSIGIELQTPIDAQRTQDIYTDEQYGAVVELLADIAARTGIPLDRDHLLGHYDVSPMRRSTAAGGYDPGERFRWNRLFDSLALVSK